uniref:DDHD domain-containing protein n=1 Tax=Eptatretus burgeri TaxID=7764 RepID=A0A8C4WZC3_EPTBU
MVPGIGPTCDLRCRGPIACVNAFRQTSLSLLASHFPPYTPRLQTPWVVQDPHSVSQLDFTPCHLFALGSPIAAYLAARGQDTLCGYQLSGCAQVFNIFHPLDPVAYRLEPLLVNDVPPPVLLPHHRGRERLHREVRAAILRLSVPLRAAWKALQHQLAGGGETAEEVTQKKEGGAMEGQHQDVGEHQRESVKKSDKESEETATGMHAKESAAKGESDQEPGLAPKTNSDSSDVEKPDGAEAAPMGRLNGGRRVDFVLQEAPIESVNEYLFALQSHLCYWESEDTALFLLKEMYRPPSPEVGRSKQEQGLKASKSGGNFK